jgi:hypothetical protein
MLERLRPCRLSLPNRCALYQVKNLQGLQAELPEGQNLSLFWPVPVGITFHRPKPHHDDEIVAAASAAERESLITRAGTPWLTCCAGTPNLALCGDTGIRDFIRHTRSEAPITRAHCDIATRRTDAYLIYLLHGQFSTLNMTQLLQSLPGLRDANTNGSSRNGSSWPSNTGLTHAAVDYLTMYNIVI